jgi:hypothetical protein
MNRRQTWRRIRVAAPADLAPWPPPRRVRCRVVRRRQWMTDESYRRISSSHTPGASTRLGGRAPTTFVETIARGRVYEGNALHEPSEITWMVPSATLMAVWSSMA